MSCLCNSAEGAPMPPASAPPRSHIDPFLSWYYLNSWLWTSGTTVTPTGPWHSLSILLDHPLPIWSPSKHPACSPSPLPHSPTERSEETLHQLLTAASTSSPPWATPQSEHPPSILWQLCPLILHFQGLLLQVTIPLSTQVLCSDDPNLQRRKCLSPHPAPFPLPPLAALVTKHLRKTADTAASFPFFLFLNPLQSCFWPFMLRRSVMSDRLVLHGL